MTVLQCGEALNGMCDLVAEDEGKDKVGPQDLDAVRSYGMSPETAEVDAYRDSKGN